MISIDEDMFHTIVNREEKLPNDVKKWFAVNRATGRLYLVPIEEFLTGPDSEDGAGAAKTKVANCSAVVKGHYPRYSCRRDKTVVYCGCSCNTRASRSGIFAVSREPDADIPSTWEEIVTVKSRKRRKS